MRRFEPMTLANMRQNGVRAVIASCANCGRSADVYVGHLARDPHRPEAGNRLRCSHCGGKTISTPTRMALRGPTAPSPQTIGANGLRCPKATAAGAARRPARRAGSAFAQEPATATELTHAKRRSFMASL